MGKKTKQKTQCHAYRERLDMNLREKALNFNNIALEMSWTLQIKIKEFLLYTTVILCIPGHNKS